MVWLALPKFCSKIYNRGKQELITLACSINYDLKEGVLTKVKKR